MPADPALDLSHLTEAEKRKLVRVLHRDGELQEADRARIGKMKSFVRQEDRSADALLQRGAFNDRYCIRCYRRFWLLINPWVCCCLCSLRVCRGRCAERCREFGGSFVCRVCDRSRLCQAVQCQWFYDAVKKRFKNSGSAKVIMSLGRDTAEQLAESLHSSAPPGVRRPGGKLSIEQLFGDSSGGHCNYFGYSDSQDSADSAVGDRRKHRQVQQQHQHLADSGHGGSLVGRGVYRTELTLATEDVGENESKATTTMPASEQQLPAADESSVSVSTVGLQITTFQDQLHSVLRRLQEALRTAAGAADNDASSNSDRVVDGYAKEIAELISEFAQTLHATMASRGGSPCSVEERLQRVQRLVQQEVENAIGLSVDRVLASTSSEDGGGGGDGEDSGLELEGRLADFVVQKVLDDHLVMLEEGRAAAAAAAAAATATSTSGLTTSAAASASASANPQPPAATATAVVVEQTTEQQQQQQLQLQQHLDRHIDSLFAFKASDSGIGQQQRQQQHRSEDVSSSTPKWDRRNPSPSLTAGTGGRLARRRQSQNQTPPVVDLRLGRFSSAVFYDDSRCRRDSEDSGDSEGADSVESWEKLPPVLDIEGGGSAEPVALRFGHFDWGQNERSDPRFCAKPERLTAAARGGRVAFVAVVDGTEPIEVIWHRLKDGRAYEICDSDKYEIASDPLGDGSFRLTIYHLADSDAGAYLLVAVNKCQAVMHAFKLKVVDNPLPSKAPAFAEPMCDTRAREGRTARFACRITGTPEPRVSFLKDGEAIRSDGIKYDIVSHSPGSYELLIHSVSKPDDAEYSCLAVNSAGSTQCDCQLLVYRLAEDDEALRRIEGEIQQTQASMLTAAKDMYRASGKIRQLDANFGRLNRRLGSMERQFGQVYPESAALQRVTGHALKRLAEHEASLLTTAGCTSGTTETTGSLEAPSVSDWSLTTGGGGAAGGGSTAGESSSEAAPQSSGSSKIVFEAENVNDGDDAAAADDDDDVVQKLETTERRIYIAASKNNLLRQKLDDLERQVANDNPSSASAANVDDEVSALESSLASLQLMANTAEAEIDDIEATTTTLAAASGADHVTTDCAQAATMATDENDD